jgi:hypothetical protein
MPSLSLRVRPEFLMLLGLVIGISAGATALTAPAALAVTAAGPGQVTLTPASGAATLKPTWSTTDACPAGFQSSAVLAAMNSNGSFGSYISATVVNPTSAFSGTLQGNVASILSLGTNVTKGGTSRWVVYCFNGPGGTGKKTPVQATLVTLSSSGSSYSTSLASGQPTSAAAQAADTSATTTGDVGRQVEAASIAGACGLVIALAGLAWYRRRRRSQLPGMVR